MFLVDFMLTVVDNGNDLMKTKREKEEKRQTNELELPNHQKSDTGYFQPLETKSRFRIRCQEKNFKEAPSRMHTYIILDW